MSRGVLLYAHNNKEIDYFKIACANALMIKKNLKVPVTIVTDKGSLAWGRKELTPELVNSCFDNIIEVEKSHSFSNIRNFSDTSYTVKPLQFYNCNHWEAYDLSPYDETLFIDVDYLIMSNSLNNCWGSTHDVMVSNKIYSPIDIEMPHSRTIDAFGIKLYWATVIYFKKSSLAEHMFSFMKHIQENYRYYRDLYFFSNGMFRNDNAVSVAIHMLNGFSDTKSSIVELPIAGLLMAWDTGDIISINGINDITVSVEKPGIKGEYLLARIKDTDIHIMNKWAINRHAQTIISLYRDHNE